jgi:predicted permease
MALGFLGGKRRTIDNLNVGSINSGDDLRDKPIVLVALLVQPLFGAAIAVLVHVPVAYAHVAILILALPGGFFGVLFGLPYNARSHSRGRR